jgi:hypothetical protein
VQYIALKNLIIRLAKQHNDKFHRQKSKIVNLFTKEFLNAFCQNGEIDWKKLVEFNSGNLDIKR